MLILLVEDDLPLARGLQQTLTHEGHIVNQVSSGEAALFMANEEPPDALLLDINLPDISGLKVLTRLRTTQPSLPVLLLTARDSLEDKVLGLDSGADDYLTKPFDMPELISRLRVIERRLAGKHCDELTQGAVTLNSRSHEATCDSQPIALSKREFSLLRTLMENAGRILSKQQLEAHLYSWDEDVSSNAIEVHIHHLRRKLPVPLISTIRGIGYTIKPS